MTSLWCEIKKVKLRGPGRAGNQANIVLHIATYNSFPEIDLKKCSGDKSKVVHGVCIISFSDKKSNFLIDHIKVNSF